MRKHLILFSFLVLLQVSLFAQFVPKVSPLKTPWTDKVDKNNPLPEYPRPQMVRADWMNLNGQWEFKNGAAGDAVPQNQTLGTQITVPFAPEATLSGVLSHNDRVWYRKLVTVPSAWSGKRILIHFGAIDWESEVYINGVSKGIHKGGYDEIIYDITDQLVGTGPQEIIVRVYDPTRDFGQPRGKQTTAPGGIMYTCTTGIWQTVWLEPVTVQNIGSLKITPDIDNNQLKIKVISSNATGLTITATAKDGSTIVGKVSGNANADLIIPVPNAKLWSPNSPFLYDLDVQLKNGDVVVDAVSSYFGMRKIAMVRDSPTPRVYLNNKPIFMMGPLDQGFWPDGIYTAPTDEALKSDIEAEKALGFNMVRKHIKVEPQRWYYWADKLGIMVWQDMPSCNSYDAPSGIAIEKTQFNNEMTRMINTHFNSPSIILWVIFNEWQGEFDSPGRTQLVKSLDPTRLINQGSGHERSEGACDILDGHYYSPPKCPTSTTSAVVCGEYGGLGLAITGHLWSTAGNPYGDSGTGDAVVKTYSGFTDKLLDFKKNLGMCGAVYTEITDVESEINGFLTYDRIFKFDPAPIKAINEKIINENIVSQSDVLPTADKVAQTWKYVTAAPATGWNTATFNDAAWASAVGGFGTRYDASNKLIGTLWNGSDIWIRKAFTIGSLSAVQLKYLKLSVFHDENCEIYINGILASTLSGYTSDYVNVDINQAAKNALILNGTNTIAIHCHQTTGGQYIDAGLSFMVLSGEDMKTNGAVVAYTDCQYLGTATRIDVGEYDLAKLTSLGIIDKSISSIKVAEGYKAILYDSDNLTGNSTELTASSTCLTDAGWNDKLTSMKVVANGDQNLGGIYTLQNRNSSLNMEVAAAGLANGTNIFQNTANQNANQQFLFTHLGDGVYKITAIHSLKQVDVDDKELADTANVQQWSNTGEANQQFIAVSTGDGYYKLIAKYSARVVDVFNAGLTANANVQTAANSNQTSGMWKLNPVTLSDSGDGLMCNFYNGMNFEQLVLQQKNTKLDFDWGFGSPDPAVKIDAFSARWTGQILPKYSETYTFFINSDNGRRLWVNNQLIIDKWLGDWGIEYSGTIALTAGQKYDIKIEYYEEAGGANFQLRWSSPSLVKEIIPQSQLFSNSMPTVKLSTPNNKTSFTEKELVTLSAAAANPTGAVTRVDFYDGATLLGQATTAPYELLWQNMTIGQHNLKAVIVCDNAITLPSAQVAVQITEATGLEYISNSSISIYPNPVAESIVLHSTIQTNDLKYTIFNTAGQQQMVGLVRNNKINVQQLPTGVYTIQLSNSNLFVSKIIVKK